MGRPKVKIIDDSQPETEIKSQKSKVKTSKEARSEPVEDTSAVIASEVSETRANALKQSDTEEEIATSSLDKLETPRNDEKKKAQKPGKAKPRSKKYLEVTKDLDRNKAYPLNEALDLVKKVSYSKYEGTLEAHINTIQTGIRGLVSLPFASGKKLTILAFGKDADKSGADIIGTEETIKEINEGKLGFDILVTSPDWMPKLAKVARILGPRGLMPNPKNGTISSDLKKTVEGFQSGKTEYKTEPKAPVIHIALGKLSQPTEELSANVKILLQTVGKTRITKVSLSPTMGPSVKVDLSSI